MTDLVEPCNRCGFTPPLHREWCRGPLEYCPAGWAGCKENYTGGHLCARPLHHPGPHRCDCRATTRRKDAFPTLDTDPPGRELYGDVGTGPARRTLKRNGEPTS